MWPFSRKERVNLETFCREFYDRQILNPEIAGVDAGKVYYETVRCSVAEVDSEFAIVDAQDFRDQMRLIYFEVFGLAWLHVLGDKHAAAQSDFTKRYLEERGQAGMWNALEPYNSAIARSSTLGQSSDTAAGRGYLAFRNRILADSFDRWHSRGFDPKVVARAANRLCTDVACEKGDTAAFLMFALCEQLGCEPNEKAQGRLIAVIRGLYDGVHTTLKAITVAA